MPQMSAVQRIPFDFPQLCDPINLPAVRRLAFDSACAPLLGGIVHELRNQLQTVTGVLPMILDGSGAEIPENLRTLAAVGVERSLSAVQALTALLELRRDSPPGPTPVAEIIDLVVGLEAYRRRRQAVAMQTRIAETAPVACSAFDGACALLLLVNNAVDAIGDREDGRIEIDAMAGEAWVTIEIRDNGGGFDLDPPDRAFELYVGTRPGQAGLGLPLARALVSRVGGIIELAPTAGQPAGIRIRLPVWQAPV